MKTLTIVELISLTILLILSTFSYAGEKVDRSLDTGKKPAIKIENVRGEIAIKAWDKNSVHVKGTLDDKAEKLIFNASQNKVNIIVKTPRNLSRGSGSDLTIKVPVGSSIDAGGVSTDFSISGVMGAIDTSSVSGEINVRGGRGLLTIETVSGDIIANEHEGQIDLQSVSGDIAYAGSASEIETQAVSGDIDIRNQAEAKDIETESVSGDISIETGLSKKAQVSLEAVSGDVTLDLTDTNDVTIEAASLNGDIDNDITNDKAKKEPWVGRSLNTQSGNGRRKVSIETISGDIDLK